MCGLCGKIYFDPQRPVEREIVTAMARCIHHRGPDEDGWHFKGNCGLGHKRLSIIDLSTGRQPIYNEDNTCCIVFNGEIYNFHELREGLIARGHQFRTRSDTETILHLYEEKRERCVEDLRGMFAFAIWNERDQELLLARDRVGVKPLFYAATDRMLVFGSELKALLAEPSLKREMNLESLHNYLTYQYVPPPETIFKGFKKLPPAHTLVCRRGVIQLRQYWDIHYEPKLQLDEADACERIRFELDEAVRIRLESEVPLGCLLSGGLDSSAVVAYMRRHISGPLRTFSIGFEEQSHNELQYARVIAEKFQTVHEEFVVRPKAIEVLPKIVWHFDEPFSDSSGLPSYYLAEITRSQVTVALNGDGGDESFAGYSRYQGLASIRHYQKIPAALRRFVIGPILQSLTAICPGNARLERLNYAHRFSLYSPGRAYAQHMVVFRDYMKPRLYSNALRKQLAGLDSMQYMLGYYNRGELMNDLDRKLCSDVMTYLPGALLVKMDRMTMAHGVEGRSPFLDHKFMEFAARLPAAMKFKNGTLKYLLKQALEPVLPRDIIHRPKQGFGLPISEWFKGELQPLLRDTVLSDRALARGFFNPDYVRKLVDDHVSGRQNHYQRLWSLLCFEVWCRTYLDQADPTAGPIRL